MSRFIIIVRTLLMLLLLGSEALLHVTTTNELRPLNPKDLAYHIFKNMLVSKFSKSTNLTAEVIL